MIQFSINISNPFWSDRWSSLKYWSCDKPRNNKSWEIQLMKSSELIGFDFDWTTRQDHAGIRLELGVAGYKVAFNWSDTRHWHTEKNRWVNYDDPAELEELYGKHWNK